MADNVNSKSTTSYNFLPKIFRSDPNKKFLQATLDQLVTPGTVKKINGFVGRQNSKATVGDDIFISAVNNDRQNYQLEPGFTIKDKLDNTTFFKDYQDYINQLNVFGANISNHSRVNNEEFYSWNPHIDWDKFVNFQNYYWLPNGPDVIKIAGQQLEIISTYNVTLENQLNTYTYLFTPNGLERNPTLTLFRGQTYNFEINCPGQPFSIKNLRTAGPQDRYQTIDFNQFAVETGTITITIPYDAPDVLYYVSEANVDVGGVIHVLSIEENTYINVDDEIIGKQTYTLPSGTKLSNGMMVTFTGRVEPEKYASGQFYVEGVGSEIILINKNDLELISAYTTSEAVLFDSTPFDEMPFSDATSLASSVDYHVVNRASMDKNPWSRYNRWIHKDVINTSAELNGKIPSLNQNQRAVRPIIEFEAGLRLYNFGTRAVPDVDLIDTFTTDVFSTIEGTFGYNIDGVSVSQGQRILFTADTDVLVKNKIYRVEFLDVLHLNDGSRQIHLVLEDEPELDDTVIVKYGNTKGGVTYWFNGTVWQESQQKVAVNQPPVFDLVDSEYNSFGNESVYEGTTFQGTKLFSYKAGTGTVDANLGFALSYKNINNVGDIVFNFNILTDSFQYKKLASVFEKKCDVGFLIKTSPLTGNKKYLNGWEKSVLVNTQAAVRIYKDSGFTNNFRLDIFDDVNNLDDLKVKIYVNGIRLDAKYWSIANAPDYKRIVLNSDIELADVLTIRAFAKQKINSNGYYEIPINLQNNPLNGTMKDFTLGEVIDHVGSIVDNIEDFEGIFPGSSNIRDLGNVSPYGTKFVQHAGPLSLSLYHVTSQSSNIIRGIEKARDDYGIFKRNFINVIEVLDYPNLTDYVGHVNAILNHINKDKSTTGPYYFSDMIGYTASIVNTYTVIDYRIKTYPVLKSFDLTSLSNKAVYVYLNGTHLVHGKDYVFDSEQSFVVIKATLANDDVITVYEYDSTDGCFIPATPTKLGIWPAYEPKIYLDTSLVTPRTMIQGHDGSQVLAYGDYRDELILELEKRIFNNIKIKYQPEIFDVKQIEPSYVNNLGVDLDEFNKILAPQFFKWTSFVDRDFSKPLSFNEDNSFTWNYKDYVSLDGRNVPGYWRGIYRWMFGTDRPHLCPWEILGFTLQPEWWESVYGPAPYTSDNLILWQDMAEGLVREPEVPTIVLEQYVRPYLLDHIPVDQYGQLRSPYSSEIVEGTISRSTAGDYVFGDVSPIEAAWRRSSHYPFSFLITSTLINPAMSFGTLLDRSRIKRNIADQLVYTETELRITPGDVVLPSIYSSPQRVYTSGLINYVVDYILSDYLRSYDQYTYDLKNISAQISLRLGGFTSKEKFNFILDSKNPLSSGGVFIPQEDYNIILNSSSPIKKIVYSGIIITKLPTGFEVKGYSKTQPYFYYYPYNQSGPTINVGGISEGYTFWTVGSLYVAGKVVNYQNKFYRVKVNHTAEDEFNSDFYQALGSLPMIGGKEATTRVRWDRSEAIIVPYGTKFDTIQDTYDFIVGYGEWLKDQGFIFDDFNTTLRTITNWETSAKEFLFWTTQNWNSGQDKWKDWSEDQDIEYQEIVKYNGDYYQAKYKVFASPIFNEQDFVKLDGLSTVGSSVISLSPSASALSFSTPYSVVDDIRSQFNGYEIYRVDGSPIVDSFISTYREDNAVTYSPSGEDGIFGAVFYLVQKEQVVLLNNQTMFGDTIYNLESGYRQERIKVAGYLSSDWNGGFNVPGFIYDEATINDWTPWIDYNLGDIVKYKEFYYSAASSLKGVQDFNTNDWIKLSDKPVPRLIPNWSYKAEQFTDFYSLDSDNFDAGQQQVAQHLIGYQKRQYLSNIIQDDVSEFKFYQGMIADKGTANSLDKLFDVFGASGKENLDFYEEWAIRVGLYGANAAFENIEFVLDESLFKNNPQGFELVNSVDRTLNDFIVRQVPSEIYLKPLGYNNNPWPLKTAEQNYLRSAGFVRADEVKTVLTTLDKILLENIDDYENGSYVWVGFEGISWNVYRYTPLDIKIINATYSNSVLTLETDRVVDLEPGSYIGIEKVGFKGFYQISSVSVEKIIINKTITGWTPFQAGTDVPVFALKSQLAESIDTVDDVLSPVRTEGETLWTKDKGDGKWGTWKYSSVFASEAIPPNPLDDDLLFGRLTVMNLDGNVAFVSDTSGQPSLYTKPVPGVPWTKVQIFLRPVIANDVLGINPNQDSWFAESAAFSPDGYWLAVGHPRTGLAATKFRGTYNPSSSYVVGDLVKEGSTIYEAIVSFSGSHPPSSSPTYWTENNLIETVNAATNTGPLQQGAVSVYFKNSIGLYSHLTTFVSPTPTVDELFGYKVTFGDNTLFVSTADSSSKIYQLNYASRVQASSLYNPVGSTGTTIKVSSTVGVKEGMTVVGTGFTQGQQVISVVNSTTLTLSAPADGDAFGRLNFVLTSWAYDNLTGFTAGTSGNQFGDSVVVSRDSSTMVVSAPAITSMSNGVVYVYKKNNAGVYNLAQTISGTETRFGQGIAITDTASYIAISSSVYDGDKVDQGKVVIYEKNQLGNYVLDLNNDLGQVITSLNSEQGEMFGSKIFFMNNDKTLVIFSASADSRVGWDLTDGTTFDDSLTTFYLEKNIDGGRVDIYDRYNKKWIFGESLETDTDAKEWYGASITVGGNYVFVGAPYAIVNGRTSGKLYSYIKKQGAYSWTLNHYEIDKVDLSKIKSVFLYNKRTSKFITYLDVIDSSQGKIPGIADQEIRYKTYFDPAIYSTPLSETPNTSVKIDDGLSWGKLQVGTLWWDLRTTKFVDSNDNDTVYRNSTWNSLFPGSTVDIYEWVESKYKPVDWNTKADTEEGLAAGISGQTLYGNNTYSYTKKWDNIAKNYKYTYYYWVKDKKTIPNTTGRYISSLDVAGLIGNPRGQAYRYLALTSSNSFSLVNVSSLLSDKDVVLSVEYWVSDPPSKNIHSQWKLISTNNDTVIPDAIEQKWVDSLCGKDDQGRVVPDPALPPKLLYGIENRPRQGMFINRLEALKQYIEYVNRVLINTQISGQRDFSLLDSYEKEPSLNTGLYDVVLDTDLELRFANVGSFVLPHLTPIIENGSIVGATVVDSGRGYIVAPVIDVVGSGFGASIKALINSKGQITGIKIISPGYGYDTNTVFSIRSYAALVHTDTAATGTWSIYSYDPVNKVWSRIRSQSYDTRKYWNYVNWYASGYSEYTAINFAVETFADLNNITPSIGQTVKVRTSSSGTWFLLEKYSDTESIDWTQVYKVVGQENGTIQLSSSLYRFQNTDYGFDGALYDNATFDNSATTELRNILVALKNNILVDTLEYAYLGSFFNTIRYILNEQTYVDWIFKTSFVKVNHNVGELHQPVNYKNDNLADFESYVSEVKPYRTKIREYISTYNKVDPAQLLVTDFDLQPAYQNGQISVVNASVQNNQIVSTSTVIDSYPWKNWLDNASYKVISIQLVDNGTLYHSPPVVRFISTTGTGAEARAFIANGKVNRIVLLNSGSGYLSAPQVILEGGLEEGGTSATAVAIIGGGVTRSQTIRMKFDRITQNYFITQLEETETFNGTGSRLQFPLKWGPDVRVSKSTVTVNGVEELRDNYKLVILKSISKGYTSYSGSIIFENAPAKNATVIVTYTKDWSLLNAADRVQFYYNPTTGQIGKDLAQLMTGIDYGGVVLDGLDFDVGQGWDNVPYFTERWDSADPTFDDFIVTTGSGDHEWTLSYVPTAGTEINVYHIKLEIDALQSDGINLEYPYNTNMVSPRVRVKRYVNSGGVVANYNSAGSFGTTLKVSSTTGITPGMLVVGTEFTTQTVVTVSNSTTLILSAAPSLPPANGTALKFTLNKPGVDILSVSSTTGLAVGDVVTTTVNGVLGLNTTVTQIISSTQVKLNQILYGTIEPSSPLTFTRNLVKNIDYALTGFDIAVLTVPAPNQSWVEVYSLLEPIRLDDPDYGTPAQTNSNAIMETIVSTGVSSDPTVPAYDIAIPLTYTINDGDQIIIRKSTSDGSIKPDEADYDTALSGGNFAYSTATGLLPEDIIVDGDGFVTPTSSPAPEEVVPGQLFDTVSIKVYDKPYAASAVMRVDNFVADGINNEFILSQKPNTKQAVIVKIIANTVHSVKTAEIDYTFDYQNNSVSFTSVPPAKSIVSVYSFGFNGGNILDIDYFIGNSTTEEFITKAPWLAQMSYLIYLNGEPCNAQIFKTDETYDSPNRVGIRFGAPPASGDIITYSIVAGNQQTFAVTKTEKLATDGSLTYDLTNVIGDSLPIESNVLVRVNQNFLTGPTNQYFTIKSNKYNYPLDPITLPPYSIDITDLKIYANGTLLTLGNDYTIDLSVINVKISPTIASQYKGHKLIVNVTQNAEYVYTPPQGATPAQITFTQAYSNLDTVEIISSYKHDILDIERTVLTVDSSVSVTPDTTEYYSYVGVSGGNITLRNPVIDENYVWLIQGGKLLVPSVDYVVKEDKITVKLTEYVPLDQEINVITFGSNVLSPGIAYMQFKDMLNRDHFKRLSLYKQTRLTKPLKYNDVSIEVEDASNFDVPNPAANKPGILEIRGERIEYFQKNGNVLSQLRRGTLGTGAPNVHPLNSFVQDIGPSETIPYVNEQIIQKLISDGTNTVNLNFIPGNFNTTYTYQGLSMTAEDSVGLAKDSIEVFVGGYNIGAEWASSVTYSVGDIITLGSYTYRCISNHTSSDNFVTDYSKWEFFIGNLRLRKDDYKVYNVNKAPESPEGDVNFDAEFTVDGSTNVLTLRTPLDYGTNITVIRKKGVIWDSTINLLKDDNNVATFLKAVPGIWYQESNKYQSAEAVSTFDSSAGSFDSNDITFDQG